MRPDAFIDPYAYEYLRGKTNIFIAKDWEISQRAETKRSLEWLETAMETSHIHNSDLEESTLEDSTLKKSSLEDDLKNFLLKKRIIENFSLEMENDVMEMDELEGKSNAPTKSKQGKPLLLTLLTGYEKL